MIITSMYNKPTLLICLVKIENKISMNKHKNMYIE